MCSKPSKGSLRGDRDGVFRELWTWSLHHRSAYGSRHCWCTLIDSGWCFCCGASGRALDWVLRRVCSIEWMCTEHAVGTGTSGCGAGLPGQGGQGRVLMVGSHEEWHSRVQCSPFGVIPKKGKPSQLSSICLPQRGIVSIMALPRSSAECSTSQ